MEAQEDISELGSRIHEIHSKDTLKINTRIISRHIKLFTTTENVINTAERWIQDIELSYTILETENLSKGKRYRVPKEWTTENPQKENQKSDGIKLNIDFNFMKGYRDGYTFLLCIDTA